jgi:hypothetical protein
MRALIIVLLLLLAKAAQADTPAWTKSEQAILEQVRKVYTRAGLTGLDEISLAVEEDCLLPRYTRADRTLHVPPFTGGVAAMRRHTARASALVLNGAFTLNGFSSQEAAREAYLAFLVAAIAHEVAHHVQRGAPSEELEQEAVRFEQAFLRELVETGQVSRTWLDGYQKLNEAVVAALVLPAPDAESAAFAGLTRYRLQLLKKGGPGLKRLVTERVTTP